jgi:hypothetical protein
VALACVVTVGCNPTGGPGGSPAGVGDAPGASSQSGGVTPAAPGTLPINLLFMHGVDNCDADRQSADQSLVDLESSVVTAFNQQAQIWQQAHPGITLVLKTARANLYTAASSPNIPSGSTALHMDDWRIGSPGTSSKRQGDPGTTAYEWRYRTAGEVKRLFGNAGNVVIIGHSTTGRSLFEVASNTGPDGVGTYDWGVQKQIVGGISLHGMIDSLGSSQYSVQLSPFGFVDTCELSNPIYNIGGSCGPGAGWCEYAGEVSGLASEDWVAKNLQALSLVSWGSCSNAIWNGLSDGSLPYGAQASALAPGLDVAPETNGWAPVNGQLYGHFCHAAPTRSGSQDQHADAVNAASNAIVQWLLVSAPNVAGSGSQGTPQEAYNNSTPDYSVGGTCPTAQIPVGFEATGVCHHPGGGDHQIAASELTVTPYLDSCGGGAQWTQAHDPSNTHEATLYWKSLSQGPGGLADKLLLHQN